MNVGSSIRAIRNRKKITITEMSEATGLSKGFISNIENGNTSPSINTMETIAKFLDVPLTYFFLKNEDKIEIVKKQDRSITLSQLGNLKIEHISSRSGLYLQNVELAPGTSISEKPHSHQGIECHFILQGKILVEQGEESFVLEEGDSFSWNASVPHMVRNIGEESAVVLIAVYSDSKKDE
jgi:transcriptional regulator with XRE-family HTH domain